MKKKGKKCNDKFDQQVQNMHKKKQKVLHSDFWWILMVLAEPKKDE